MDTKVVAFMGAGVMGKGMINNLLKSNFKLHLYNRSKDKLQDFQSKNSRVFNSPAEAAKGADIIIASVLNDVASKEIWFGKDGVVKTANKGAICIETSTLSIPYTDYWVSRISGHNLLAIDCPVTGSKVGAESATLSLFIGGEDKDIKKVMSVFKKISKQQFYIGPAGFGMRFKLIYNMLGGTILVALSEAVGFAQKLGLDPHQVVAFLAENNQGWSQAAAQSKGERMANCNHSDVACKLSIILKDLSYAKKSAKYVRQQIPTSESALRMLKKAQKLGYGDLDMSAVANLFIKPS